MTEIAQLDELKEGVPSGATVNGRDVVLIRWRGEVFAVRDICPHQSLSLVRGRVHARLTGKPGAPSVDQQWPVLKCPWHSWEYSLRDGVCVSDPHLRVRSYPVEVRDGRVLIDLDTVAKSGEVGDLGA